MNNHRDWLATAFESLKQRPSTDMWPPAADIGRRAGRRRLRRRVGLTLGGVAGVLAVALLIASVAVPEGSPPSGPLVRKMAGPDGSAHLLASARQTGSAGSSAVAELASSEQAFALDLTRKVLSASPGSNVLLSPMSADIDLSMLELGAEGQTEQEIAATLQSSGLTAEENASAWKALVSSELAGEPSGALKFANSLWVDQHVQVETAFLRAEATNFGNDTYQVDFASPTATKAINSWVDQATGGRISELFATGELSPTTAVVLANALHLHAAWANTNQFTTKTQPFAVAGGSSVSVPMLTSSGDQLDASATPSYAAAQIPLSGGRFAALVIEPEGNIDSWLASLTPQGLAAIVGSLSMGPVALTMPAVDLSNRPLLNTALSTMGMAHAFEAANLTPMLGNTSGRTAVVTKVQQADTLQVTSEGIDAAAATGISAFTSLEGTIIDVDRPYLFLVRDTKTGAILFSSVVNNPTGS